MAHEAMTDSGKGRFSIEARPLFFNSLQWLAALILMVLANPNPLIKSGFFPLAYPGMLLLFLLTRRLGYGGSLLAGLLFWPAFYLIFNYWLLPFHSLTIIIVPLLAVVIMGPLFPLLTWAARRFPSTGFLVQVVIWVVHEYLRTRGFLGYSYGLTGYTQYLFLPLIQWARWTGVWGVSFLVMLPCAYGAAWINGQGSLRGGIRVLLLWVGAVVVGTVAMAVVPSTASRTLRVGMVQQNASPWRSGVEAYGEALDDLIRLSLEAEKENPDIMFWSETAFIPAIDYHWRYKPYPASFQLVSRLLEFMAQRDIPYLIGNDDGQRRITADGKAIRIDYNASLLFEDGQIVDRYRKIHLVPFTEHFPFGDILPWMEELLINADTHFWEKGDQWTVFEGAGVRFATPICFEDSFGYISRRFVGLGADLLAVITNDSWSGTLTACEQHLQIGVFRAVENGRSMVRATNNGITSVVDANGRILERLPALEEGSLVADVPVYTEGRTLYTWWGNWFPLLLIVVLVLVVGYSLLSRRRED